jgi:hypothetical protein
MSRDFTSNSNSNSSKSQSLVHIDQNRISARELHKYVVGLVGTFMLCLFTYPIAIHRVSQQEKFAPYRSHLKSLTPACQSIVVPDSLTLAPK